MEYTSKLKERIQEFYQTWLKIKEDFIKNLEGTESKNTAVQLLFNRIIVLYFLEKKGLLNRDITYIKNLYSQAINNKENFYSEYLTPLFFDVLSREHDPEEDVKINGKNFGKIPYMNGNLFSGDQDKLLISNDLWETLFNLLDKYKWTLTENDTEEFVLTPKVLGFIYEKSVISESDRNNFSYFTPQDTSRYIIQTTILPFIYYKLEKEFGKGYSVISLTSQSDLKIDRWKREEVEYLLKTVLHKIRIVDNSCGSGAFLVGILDYLFDLNIKCLKILNVDYDPVSIKRDIITNNIYGVDIQKDAIEISRLRLWLSLLSEEIQKGSVTPLPNLEYNILSGNSLIGKIDLNDLEQMQLTSDSEIYDGRRIKDQIKRKNELVTKYKNVSNYNEKKILKEEIEKINNDLRLKLNRDLLFQFKELQVDFRKDSIDKLRPFHWIIEFSEVFDPALDRSERGFDLVIGNPPYGNILTQIEKEYLEKVLYSVKGDGGSNNAASVFIESSYRIMNEYGHFGMIVPNTIARKDQFRKIRNFLLENTMLYEIIDEGNPFKDSKVNLEMISIFFSRRSTKKDYSIVVVSKRHSPFTKSEVSTSVFKQFGWFVLYYDPTMEDMDRNCHKIGEFGSFFGAKRPYKLGQSFKKNGEMRVAKGMNIKPFVVVSKSTIDRSEIVMKYQRSLSYPLLIVPEVSNTVKAALCESDVIPLSGVMIWRPNLSGSKMKYYLLLYLNSSVVSFFYSKYIINKSTLTTHLDSTYLERIPIPITKNMELYSAICKMILYLHKESEEPLQLKYSEFLMNQVVDPLFFNLVFRMGLNLEDYLLSIFPTNEVYSKDLIISIKDNITSNQTYQDALDIIRSSQQYKLIKNYKA